MRFIRSIIPCAERYFFHLIRCLNWAGLIALIIMMVILCTNIIVRIFYQSLLGVFEVVGLLGVILASFSIPHTQVLDGHVNIPILVSLLPSKTRIVITRILWSISLGVFCIVTWRTAVQAKLQWTIKATTETLKTALYPFGVIVSLGFALLCLVFFFALIKPISKEED